MAIHSLGSHRPHLGVSDPCCLKLGIRGPFQKLVAMRIFRSPEYVMRKHIELGTVQSAFFGRVIGRDRNLTHHWL